MELLTAHILLTCYLAPFGLLLNKFVAATLSFATAPFKDIMNVVTTFFLNPLPFENSFIFSLFSSAVYADKVQVIV